MMRPDLRPEHYQLLIFLRIRDSASKNGRMETFSEINTPHYADHNIMRSKDLRIHHKTLSCLLTMVVTAAIGCGRSPDSAASPVTGASTADGSSASIRAVVTVGMVADLVRQVGGDRVNVVQIMGSGVDPHLYKATRDDVRLLMDASIVFYAGLMLEGRMTETLQRMEQQKPVVAVTEQIPESSLLKPDDAGDHWDPHVWMDIEAWSRCVGVIAERLALLDADGRNEYVSRAEALQQELAALHQYGQQCIQSIPADKRVLITSHDAFNYFGRAYGLEVVGVQGLSTESEAGLQRINELVDLLVDRRISAVFVESSVPRRNIMALIDGARSRGHEVTIGGELFSDAMGSPGTWEGTYLGMLDHNLTLVTRALGGSAPPRGFRGRLAAASP